MPRLEGGEDVDSTTLRRSPSREVTNEVRPEGCEKERDGNRLAVEGLDGVDKVQVKERPGEGRRWFGDGGVDGEVREGRWGRE